MSGKKHHVPSELNLRCQELETNIKSERENNARQRQKEEEELRQKLEKWKEKMENLNLQNKELERNNADLTEELDEMKNKIKKITVSEGKIKEEHQELADKLENNKIALDKALKNQEIVEAELHMNKMQLLKESNINNRLLDELKRTRKEIDEYKEEISKLKKSKDNYKNNVSQQIKELSILITENNKENVNDDMREIRLGLSTILKENFVLHSKLDDVYKEMTKGDPEVNHIATQTSIGLDQMYSYDNMDREVTAIVMRLREELVSNKSDMLELKQQNQQLKYLLADIEKEKHQKEVVKGEENRVQKLEEAVRSLKKMLDDNEKVEVERDYLHSLEKLKRDVEVLKRSHVQVKHSVYDHSFDINPHPIKLVTNRK